MPKSPTLHKAAAPRPRKSFKKAAALAAAGFIVAGGALVAPVVAATPAHAINVCHTVVVAKKYTFAQSLIYCDPFHQYNKAPRCYGDVTKVVCSQ